MPKQYEAIRDSMIASGMSTKQAKKRAAMTYNAHREAGTPPVTNHEGLGDALAGKKKR
jgi:hypothetical protein